MTDISFRVIETPRLRLRRFAARDLDTFIAYRSQPGTARFQSWDAPFPRAEAEAFLAELETSHPLTPGARFQFAVATREDDHLVGDMSLRTDGDEPGLGEVGYTLDARQTGRGYAAEAVAAVLGYAFDRGLTRIEALAYRRHDRSLALLARLGFVPMGVPPRVAVFKGETCEDIGHVMTADAWRVRQGSAGTSTT